MPVSVSPVDPSFTRGRNPTRWLMLALVWLLYFGFGVAMGSMPPLVSPIMEDLWLTYSEMGLVFGSWQLVYVLTAIPLGATVDRLSVRTTLGLGALVVLLSLVTRGLAVDFFTLLVAVGLFGVGGPIISTGAPKIVALWFEGAERGVAAGIYSTGPIAGLAFGLATAGSLVISLTGSWRGISLIYGIMYFVILCAWWLLAREAPSERDGRTAQKIPEKPVLGTVLRGLLRLRNVRLVLLLGFGAFLLADGLGSWIPALLQESGMTLAEAGFWTASATAAGALGRLTIATLTTHGHRVAITTVLFAVCAVTTLGLALLGGPGLVGTLIAFSLARASLMPVLMLLLMETPGVGARRMGAAAGLFFTAAEIGGFGGAILLGLLRDAFGSLTLGVVVVAVVTAVLATMASLAREERSVERES